MAEAETNTNGAAPAAPDPNWHVQFLEGINKLNENFTDFRRESRQAQTEYEEDDTPEAPPTPAPALPDFDSMSQKEVAQWLMNHFGTTVVSKIIEQVNAAIAPIRERQLETVQATLEERYTREITELIGEKTADGKLVRPDFQDWNSDMIAIVKELPGIKPEDAYKLARSRNAKRAGELDTKYNPPPPPPKSPFSFAPGSGVSSAPDKSTKPASRDEAFKNALSKVKEKWGDQYALGQREF